MNDHFKLNITNEVGRLRCLIIHSPDKGLGQVVPSKAQDWLFEDIVHLNTVRSKEYDIYVKILMYFLDPEKIKAKKQIINAKDRSFFKPDNVAFHHSKKVIELQTLLSDILTTDEVRKNLVAAVCAIEGCTYNLEQELINTSPIELAKIFISGSLNDQKMIFAPIPNLIFTRDIGITINNHILLNRPAKSARSREALLARYIFFKHPIFSTYKDNIIEIPDTVQYFLRPDEEEVEKITIEGGDVMMVSKNHLLIGCSERTSLSGAVEAIKILFDKNVIQKATIIKIPHKRDFMHIDTIFTQVKRNVWAVLGSIIEPEYSKKHDTLSDFAQKKQEQYPQVIQFKRGNNNPTYFGSIKDLLIDISKNDLGCTEEVRFIYSGNNTFPFDAREQWTDSCNLLALNEGVVLGYDRNDKTIEAFKANNFNVIHAHELLEKFDHDELNPDTLTDTLILIPSAELSRARGGFHCMSMPLLRDDIIA